MNTLSHQKLASHLRAGQVYRRKDLSPFSKAIDRDLMALTSNGVLEKVAAGIYYKPAKSIFGVLPPNDNELVQRFLNDDSFLLYSWNQYNSLGLGLTQLYNRPVVYNHKRHGVFKLGNKTFDFRRPQHGFPKEVTPEFLLVDLVNNLNELAEDSALVKAQINKQLERFKLKKVAYFAKKFGKVATKHFFQAVIHSDRNMEMGY